MFSPRISFRSISALITLHVAGPASLLQKARLTKPDRPKWKSKSSKNCSCIVWEIIQKHLIQPENLTLSVFGYLNSSASACSVRTNPAIICMSLWRLHRTRQACDLAHGQELLQLQGLTERSVNNQQLVCFPIETLDVSETWHHQRHGNDRMDHQCAANSTKQVIIKLWDSQQARVVGDHFAFPKWHMASTASCHIPPHPGISVVLFIGNLTTWN